MAHHNHSLQIEKTRKELSREELLQVANGTREGHAWAEIKPNDIRVRFYELVLEPNSATALTETTHDIMTRHQDCEYEGPITQEEARRRVRQAFRELL